jgi:adenylate cyclase class IV
MKRYDADKKIKVPDERPRARLEIKYRGPLTTGQIARLLKFLKVKGTCIKVEEEHALYFESTAFPSIGDFNWGIARISVKTHKRTISLRLKEGNAGNHKRQEYEIRMSKSEAPNLFYILHRLGLTEAFYRPAFRHEYRLGNLFIIIKQKCVMGDHFELQLQSDSKESYIELLNFQKKFKLHCWTEKEYKTRITKFMKTSPAIHVLDAHIF